MIADPHQLTTTDQDVVVLVSEDGTPVGTAPRLTVHDRDTPLHLAFSTFLFDQAGRLLLTRRALGKSTWPGVWTNSACGHLRPGETPVRAAQRRLAEELGGVPRNLTVVLPDFRYRATDASGIVENELCPVLVGRIPPSDVTPDPSEVAELTWLDWATVVEVARRAPQLISPWAAAEIELLADLAAHPLELAE